VHLPSIIIVIIIATPTQPYAERELEGERVAVASRSDAAYAIQGIDIGLALEQELHRIKVATASSPMLHVRTSDAM